MFGKETRPPKGIQSHNHLLICLSTSMILSQKCTIWSLFQVISSKYFQTQRVQKYEEQLLSFYITQQSKNIVSKRKGNFPISLQIQKMNERSFEPKNMDSYKYIWEFSFQVPLNQYHLPL